MSKAWYLPMNGLMRYYYKCKRESFLNAPFIFHLIITC